MIVHSELPSDVYLSKMKFWMESFTAFGEARFTGLFIGKFFSVTYHSGHEWNRRISNEKHRAIGFVWPVDGGTRVACIRLAGMTNPLSLIALYLMCLLIFFVKDHTYQFTGDTLLASLIVTAMTAGITALTDSLTERGIEGSEILTGLLVDPDNPYSK